MAKDIFDIIKEKEFNQLTNIELNELMPYCTDETSFQQMKKVLLHSESVASAPKLSMKESSKQQLDDLFAQTHNTKKIIPLYFKRGLQIAAMLVLIFSAWYFLNNQQIPQKTKLAKHEVVQEKQDLQAKLPEKDVEEKSKENTISVMQDENKQSLETKTNTTSHPAVYQEKTNAKNNGDLSEKELEPAPNSADKKLEVAKSESLVMSIATPPIEEKYENQGNKYTNFRSVSAPASSIDDIMVESSDKGTQSQVVLSMPIENIKTSLNFLVYKF